MTKFRKGDKVQFTGTVHYDPHIIGDAGRLFIKVDGGPEQSIIIPAEAAELVTPMLEIGDTVKCAGRSGTVTAVFDYPANQDVLVWVNHGGSHFETYSADALTRVDPAPPFSETPAAKFELPDEEPDEAPAYTPLAEIGELVPMAGAVEGFQSIGELSSQIADEVDPSKMTATEAVAWVAEERAKEDGDRDANLGAEEEMKF